MSIQGPASLTAELNLLERVRSIPPLADTLLPHRFVPSKSQSGLRAHPARLLSTRPARSLCLVARFSSGDAGRASATTEASTQPQPSAELRGAAKEQLQLLQALLGKGSGSESLYECSFFLRHPTKAQNGNLMHLECIASLGLQHSTPGLTTPSREQEVLVLDKTDPQFHKMQRLLREQEVVMLPDSSGLLMPVLGPGKKLVGLLMVERLGDQTASHASLDMPARRPALQQAAVGASLERPQHAFSQAELQAVQLVVSTLGKACAIEKRAALERSQLDAVQAQTNDFVSEARGSLITMRSLSSLLLPRLNDGDVNKDLASGIAAQGDHLQDLTAPFLRQPRPGSKGKPVKQPFSHPAASNSAVPVQPGRQSNHRPGLVLAPRPHRPLVAAMEQEAMQDLFSWLLDGAMQRAPPGGTVSVSAEAVDGGVAITITDTGSNLAEAMRADARTSGSASLGFASRLLKEVGGNLTLLPMPEEGPTGVSKGNCVRAWIPGIKQS
ncbi:hypothetical protein WJX84_003431 [Apatococcus fuscideae]|uniref:Uncharacterized protein n=1 Tax=Apatococcus fuscideae TaxID=2026836 RepID=A0AAW1TD90_9CHLO